MDEIKWKPMKLNYCFVSTCKNSSTKNPDKLFFKVPFPNRKAWSRAAGRSDLPTTSIDICEEYLDLEHDMENYLKWKLVKARPILKSKVPAKLLALKLFEVETVLPSTSSTEPNATVLGPARTFREDQATLCVPDMKNSSVQAVVTTVHCAVNTSVKHNLPCYNMLCSSDISTEEDNLPSTQGSTAEITERETDTDSTAVQCGITPVKVTNMMAIIENKPSQYIGIPKNFLWLVDLISKDTKLPKLHIIAVLYKLKHGDPFYKISDLLSISETTLWRIFSRTLDVISTICAQFIYWPSKKDIKKNLPLSFRCNKEYSNTESIIDCFEIQIEKPSDPIKQASTWSQYKSCNTVKFLISATPDGFINFISKGYGGRISDMKLVEESGFINIVKPNTTVLADRGFKHLDAVLQTKSIKLLRPPSVFSNKKMTKAEAIEAKTIASLRIHIERVIRRVRLFTFLKPHSTINNKLVNCIDDAATVACGLINLQSPIIKNK